MQGSAQLAHRGIQPVLKIYERFLGPQQVTQFFAGYHVSRTRHERLQYLERL